MRDAFSEQPWTIQHLKDIVALYNNTTHSAFGNIYTPAELHRDLEAQGIYIRANQQKRIQQLRKQKDAGLFNYIPGNILMIHLDLARTELAFQKKRRNFGHLAEFIEYIHGNGKAKLLRKEGNLSIVEVPIYYTKKVAKNIASLAPEYRQVFRIKNKA
jgi:allophanate hydrolase subunit 1